MVPPREKLAGSHDPAAGEWVSRLCRAVRETLGANRVVVWVYDAPAQTVSPCASDSSHGVALDELLDGWRDTPIRDFPAGCTVLLESRAIEVKHAQDDERVPVQLAADLGMGSVRFEPLAAGSPIGMVSIEPATAASAELHSLLPLVAAAVARLTSRRDSQRQVAEAEFLLELTEAATAARSLDEILAVVCERVARQVGARGASVFLVENGRLMPRVTRAAGGPRDGSAWRSFRDAPVPLGLAEAALQSGKPIVAEDLSSPLVSGWWADTLAIGSAAAAPIVHSGRVVGVIVVDDERARRFTDEEVHLMAIAAGHAAPIVERAHEQEEHSSDLRAATAIRQLLEQGTGAVSVEEAGEVLLRVALNALRVEHATLLMRRDDDRLEVAVTLGGDMEFQQAVRDQAEELRATDFRIWTLATGRPTPVFVENAAATTLLPRGLIDGLGLESFVAMPLVSDGRPLGLAVLGHSSAQRHWSEEERNLVEQLALEGSLVIENAALRAAEHARLDSLTEQAFQDPLTKLPNRALFIDRLEHALARMDRRNGTIAVLFLDLDDFKPVNDNLGHDAGDRLLVAVARRLEGCLRPEDTIARLGGDEFVVLLEEIDDVRFVRRVADRIAAALEAPIRMDGQELPVTASIGIAVSPETERDAEQLLRNADEAMYRAKREGKARYAVYVGLMPRDGADDAPPDAEPSVAGTQWVPGEHHPAAVGPEAEPIDEAETDTQPDTAQAEEAGDEGAPTVQTAEQQETADELEAAPADTPPAETEAPAPEAEPIAADAEAAAPAAQPVPDLEAAPVQEDAREPEDEAEPPEPPGSAVEEPVDATLQRDDGGGEPVQPGIMRRLSEARRRRRERFPRR